MFSRKTKYGLKALIHLARRYDRGPILIVDLAVEESIPRKFLEAILLTLKNNGILASKKGKGGGYYLNRPPGSVTFGQAIRVMEGPLTPVPCIGAVPEAKCSQCLSDETCGIRVIMEEVQEAVCGILDGTTLADALERIDKAAAVQKGVLNFCI